MKGLPTPFAEFTDDQRGILRELLRRGAQEGWNIFRSSLDELLLQLATACPTSDDLTRMDAEVEMWVQWHRAPALFLAWVYHNLTARRGTVHHPIASVRLVDAMIALANDHSLSVAEVAWRALSGGSVAGAWSEREDEALAPINAVVRHLLFAHHHHYRLWSDPRPELAPDPVVHHLYAQRSWDRLINAYPRHPLPEIVARAEAAEDTYHWIVARRFLGLELDHPAAATHFQRAADDAIALGLETEVGHLLRLQARALIALGERAGAIAALERADPWEQPADVCWYWQGLNARMLGELRGDPDAYALGRNLIDRFPDPSAVPIGRLAKRQLWRPFGRGALDTALANGRTADALAEVESAGPQDVLHALAELRAAQALTPESSRRFLRDRHMFQRHLTSVPTRFEDYLAALPDDYALRRRYLAQRQDLTLEHGWAASDEIVARLLERVGTDRVVLSFLIAPTGESRAVLFDLADGSVEAHPLACDDGLLRDVHAEYTAALAAAEELPDPGPGTRAALDRFLARSCELLAPILDVLVQAARGRSLTIVPRLQLNALPLHALPCGNGERLADVTANVSYVPNFALFCELADRAPTGGGGGVVAVHDPRGAPLLSGIFSATGTARVLTDATPETALALLGEAAGSDVLLACHGEFDPENPAASHLRLSRVAALRMADLSAEVALPRCRSVTLAACESGLVRSELSGEYVGLPAVLLSAGVPNVVASLWRVNQLATAILLADLLTNGEPTVPAALAAAQHRLRRLERVAVEDWIDAHVPEKSAMIVPLLARMEDRPFTHPDYWAGFFASGL